MELDLANLIMWLVLGLIAGALASFVMGGGYGIVGDIIVGILGAVIGGYVFSLVGGGGSPASTSAPSSSPLSAPAS